MPSRDFNIGDMLRIREWVDMSQEFGEDEYGGIKCKFYFPTEMGALCGQPFTVRDIKDEHYYSVEETEFMDRSEWDGPWSVSSDMLEYMNEPTLEIDPQSLIESVFGGDLVE